MIKYKSQRKELLEMTTNKGIFNAFRSMRKKYKELNIKIEEIEEKLNNESFIDKVKIDVILNESTINKVEVYYKYKKNSMRINIKRKNMIEILDETLNKTLNVMNDKDLKVRNDDNLKIIFYCLIKEPMSDKEFKESLFKKD